MGDDELDRHLSDLLLVAGATLNAASHASHGQDSQALLRLSRLLLLAQQNGDLGPELLALAEAPLSRLRALRSDPLRPPPELHERGLAR
jgi:hypothetical protein